MIRWFLAAALLCPTLAFATPPLPYYGEDFYKRVNAGEKNDGLEILLRSIVRGDHQSVPNGYDKILPERSCQGNGCYRHVILGYDRARIFLMGFLYLVRDNGNMGISEVYCDRVYTSNEFRGRKPGPNQIPDDRTLNTEHTWPQSLFTGRYQNEEQKSDLHHLFPSDSHMNSIRSSFPFGDVARDASVNKSCNNSRFGQGTNGGPVFEPPANHKGNVARALFYFAVRYEMKIDPIQEATLRRWNKMDPVDAAEMGRNNEIFKVQGDRNPFIDYPDLADRIADF